jgi:hypothetical protein
MSSETPHASPFTRRTACPIARRSMSGNLGNVVALDMLGRTLSAAQVGRHSNGWPTKTGQDESG